MENPIVDASMAAHGVTERLAAFVVDLPTASIPEIAYEKAQKSLFDTAACIVAGAVSEEAEALLEFAKSRGLGNAPIIGTGMTADPATAALLNGTFGHALDYDDVLSIMPAHPSTVILPALLAVAPQGTPGGKLIEAYIVGLEVGAKLGVAIGNGHYRRGWHATGTLAVFSGVAALARLLHLDRKQVRNAFGVAASTSSGLQCNFGTMTKPFHAGWAAHNAVTAVLLARAGLTANQDVFEAESGFFSTYGTERSDLSKAIDRLGDPFAIQTPGLALKKYPCCYALHRPIDALLKLRTRLDISPETVERVTCRVAPGALRPLIHSRPKTGLEAKFSLEYTLALGVLDGRFDLVAYSDAGVARPAVQALLPRMVKTEDPQCFGTDSEASQRSAGTVGFVEVTVELRDGTGETVRVDRPVGSPQHELSWQDLMEKFDDCAREAGLSAGEGEAARGHWRGLRELPDVHVAVQALRGRHS
ncbi:MmgE/PrpD family protein [Microvirga antarctica]|uniref:MmgE/PrpD family protein n=1 Tax=Microvirga antarctica TaxID=2819233 RepID=UPI001B302D4D|nr:MmgE/PrpD family protein [Microvirga antarctica]